jgi:hypothetical protein
VLALDVDEELDVVVFWIVAWLGYWLEVELDVEDWIKLVREDAAEELLKLKVLESEVDEALFEETLFAKKKYVATPPMVRIVTASAATAGAMPLLWVVLNLGLAPGRRYKPELVVRVSRSYLRKRASSVENRDDTDC